MKYLWIKSILIVTVLCGDIWAYPVNFNVQAFNALKLALLKSTNQAATAEQATQTPFYVVVVTRKATTQLDRAIVSQIREILSALINGATPPTTRLSAQSIQSTEGTVPTKIKNSLGIVVFNEYFFSGKSPMDITQEADIGTSFSVIRPGFIFAINSLSCSQGDFLNGEEVPVPIDSIHHITPSDLKGISDQETHKNYLMGCGYDVPSSQAPLQSLVDITQALNTNLAMRTPAIRPETITNRTIFWHDTGPAAQYCKNTYQEDCDVLIQQGFNYVLGNPTKTIEPLSLLGRETLSPLGNEISKNFEVQICADHQHALGVSETGKNFQILQSNYCISAPQVIWANTAQGKRKEYHKRYKKIYFSSANKRENINKMLPGAYFIHASGGTIVDSNLRKNMYQRVTIAQGAMHLTYHHPTRVDYRVQFALGGEQLSIEIYKIR